jgi:hypothetical protein
MKGIKTFIKYPIPVILAALLLVSGRSYAQTNTETFGQSRVQYRNFNWKYFDTKHFRIYHYDNAGRQLARYVSEQAENDIRVIEKKLGGDFPQHLNIMVYNSYDEYKQSNIGRKYDLQIQDIPAGTVDIVGDKLIVYYNGVHTDLRRQMRAGMSRALMERMLFGESFREMVKNAVLMNLPAWTVNGFVAYLVDGWDVKANTDWKNLIEANPKAGFYELAEKHPELAGKAFWKYITDTYGEHNMRQLLYTMQMKGSLPYGIKMGLGQTVKATYDSTLAYYKSVYDADAAKQEILDSNSVVIKVPVPSGKATIRNIKVAPRGNDIAYVQWENGEFKVIIQKTKEEQQKSVIVEGGIKDYNELPDPDYPLMAWSNDGLKLGVIYKKGTQTRLRIYNSVKGKIENAVIPPNRFDRVLGMAFMEDDKKLVISAIKKTQTDIYEFTLRGSRMTPITNDAWDDIQPQYVSGGSRQGIMFLSNRPEANLNVPIDVNELPTGPMNVFFYNTKTKQKELLQLSHVTTGKVTQPIQYGSDNYAYLYDANGVQNKYVVLMDRTVNNLDSPVSVPVTNYAYNILNHQYNASTRKIAEVVQVGDAYHVLYKDLKIPSLDSAKQLAPTILLNTEINKKAIVTKQTITTGAVPERRITPPQVTTSMGAGNTPVLRGGNVFQSEFNEQPSAAPQTTQPAPTENTETTAAQLVDGTTELPPVTDAQKPTQVLPEVVDQTGKNNRVAAIAEAAPVDSAYIKMKALPYRLGFRPDFFTVRLDNTVLFNKYQSVKQTGGAYSNPPLGGLLTISLDDVLENHRFTGGMRLPINFSGSTYFLQYENATRRTDWSILYLRNTNFSSGVVSYVDSAGAPIGDNEQLAKSVTNMVQGTVSYPFNRVKSVRLHLGLRQDDMKFKAQDYLSLAYDIEESRQQWIVSRAEYIYDNTQKPALNIYNGMRWKFFGEYMLQLNGKVGGFYNLGVDFRNYTRLYKNIIWANRLASAHSAGDQKILYHLGGVDNWMFSRYSNYVPVRPTENYAFQTLATNLRGYELNSRNGNTYAVLNSEIRVPVFATFIKHPIQSSFVRNMQVVSFLDIGSAWTGLTPNADVMRNDSYLQGPDATLILSDKTGGVGVGYGAGLRSSFFGYFVRADVAWNIEGNPKPLLHVSIGADF